MKGLQYIISAQISSHSFRTYVRKYLVTMLDYQQ